MIVQRLIIYSIMLALIIAALPAQTLCQSDPYGVMDTVTIESKIISPDSRFSVKVFLNNDEALSGITIPLKYPADLVVYDSISFANSRMKLWSTLRVTDNRSGSSLLFGGLAMDEPLLPAGEGAVAEVFFHVVANVHSGQSGLIDTAFFPPAGKFLLSSYESISIFPVFVAGNLLAGPNNEGPEFEPMSTKLVNEGETLSFVVTARDPEGSAVRLFGGKLPPLAQFKDNSNGTGTFSWTIPYLGPGSASGSPFVASFVATDGAIAVQMDVPIKVINVNRPPQISISGSVTAFSGDSVFIPLMASDPDLESITFSATNLPTGAQIRSGNPGYIIWGSSIADSGNYGLDIEALDESGGTAHEQVAVKLLPTVPIELSLSNEQAFTNEVVTIPINLHNRVDVAGFRLLIEYDPSLLTPLSILRDSTRTKYWYPFGAQVVDYGRLFIKCHAEPAIPGSIPIPPGDGAVAYLRFLTCPNPNFAGQYSRIEFKILDSLSNTENIIYQPDGTILPRSQVSLTSGSIMIKKYDALVGDLNLNLVAMEIGDAVYYTNYFLNPTEYPLNGKRWVNSDVNQDGAPGTIGDLIYLLRIIVGDVPKINDFTGTASAESQVETSAGGSVYKLTSSREVAGALMTFRIEGDDPINCVALPALADMELRSARDGNLLRILILSSKGNTFAAHEDGLFQLTTNSSAELVSQEIVDANGTPIALTRVASGGALPEEFALEQNCPNPFNPETVISYSLEKTGDVSMEIYNCLGQRVRILSTGNQAAGKHSVRFDGTDDNGAQLASGVYLYRLRVGDQQLTRKMVLLK